MANEESEINIRGKARGESWWNSAHFVPFVELNVAYLEISAHAKNWITNRQLQSIAGEFRVGVTNAWP